MGPGISTHRTLPLSVNSKRPILPSNYELVVIEMPKFGVFQRFTLRSGSLLPLATPTDSTNWLTWNAISHLNGTPDPSSRFFFDRR